MSDPWSDEGFGGGNDWDEGDEGLGSELEDGLPDPEDLADDEGSWDDDAED